MAGFRDVVELLFQNTFHRLTRQYMSTSIQCTPTPDMATRKCTLWCFAGDQTSFHPSGILCNASKRAPCTQLAADKLNKSRLYYLIVHLRIASSLRRRKSRGWKERGCHRFHLRLATATLTYITLLKEIMATYITRLLISLSAVVHDDLKYTSFRCMLQIEDESGVVSVAR